MRALISERFERHRLAYERIRPDHARELAALMAEPLVLETLWPFPDPPSPDQLRAQLGRQTGHWERHGFGLWVLRDRESGQFVGRGGLEYNHIGGTTLIEVAWAITPARWGQGLATELALTSVQAGFDDLGLEGLIAVTLPHNIASRRVMEKSGFTYEREIEHSGIPHVLYTQGPSCKPAPMAG